MADDPLAIADLIGDALDMSQIEVSDILRASPFIAALPMFPSSNGTVHKYTKETQAPVVGFRSENGGRDMDSSVETAVSIDLKILDWSWDVDQAVAKAFRRGGAKALMAKEGLRHLAAALMVFEKQVINGIIGASDSAAPTTGSAAGFAGFRDAATVNALADPMVVTAGAGTADLNSSVWAVNLGEAGVSGIYKGEGDPFEMDEMVTIQKIVNPGTDNKTYSAWYQPANTWLGLQVGSAFDIGRIANVSVAVPLTDDMIADLLSRFPVDRFPTHLIMGRRSRKQLQDSRTATNSTGTPATFPTEAFGVPIITTDAITATEELIA